MNKTLAFLLPLSLACSLCACGEPQIVEKAVVHEEYLEYSNVIDCLIKEDYDGAVALIDAMRPAPEYVEVELTMENFFDYFEPWEYIRYESAQRDAYGNVIYLSACKGYALREEYTPVEGIEGIDSSASAKAGAEYTETGYHGACGDLGINFDTLEFNDAVEPFTVSRRSEQLYLCLQGELGNERPFFGTYSQYYCDPNSGLNDEVFLITDMDVVSASGTLYLVP